MKNEQLLHNEIENELKLLENMEVGTKEYQVTVEGLTKLIDKAIEIDKLNADCEEKAKNREFDEEFKSKQMVEEKKDRLWRNGLAIAGIIVPTALTVWGTITSINFEKEGTFTTIVGRGFIQKLIPRK